MIGGERGDERRRRNRLRCRRGRGHRRPGQRGQLDVGVTVPEGRLPPVGVETARVEAGQTGEEFADRGIGEHAQHVRIGEGDVAEVHGAQIGPRLGEHLPEKREVIVLHQDDRVRRRVRTYRVGHGPVVAAVAVPGLPPVPVESGPAGQIEQVMMAVPQRRIGHDVIRRPVGVVIDDHREQREVLVCHAALGNGGAVGRAHRHRDPGRSRAGQQRADRRDQASSAGDRPELALGAGAVTSGVCGVTRVVVVEAEGERAPIGDDQQLIGRWHGGQCGARASAVRNTSVAWGRSSCSGRLRWMRTPRSTWASTPGPSFCATSMSRPISTP